MVNNQHKNFSTLDQMNIIIIVPIVQLLQVYPEGATVQDLVFEDEQEEEYDNDNANETYNDSDDDMPIVS
jgi:hypothetical protein